MHSCGSVILRVLLMILKRVLLRLKEHLVGTKLTLYILDIRTASILQGVWFNSIISYIVNSFAFICIIGTHEALMGRVQVIALVRWFVCIMAHPAGMVLWLCSTEISKYVPILETDGVQVILIIIILLHHVVITHLCHLQLINKGIHIVELVHVLLMVFVGHV